jgi:hypothetical protein
MVTERWTDAVRNICASQSSAYPKLMVYRENASARRPVAAMSLPWSSEQGLKLEQIKHEVKAIGRAGVGSSDDIVPRLEYPIRKMEGNRSESAFYRVA